MEKFVPVVVNKDKKFRGFAYDVGCEVHTSSFNIYGPHGGCAGWRHCESVKLWSPDKGYVWCNPAYIEEREVAPDVEKADYAKYTEFLFEDTVKFCRSRSVGKPESEVIKFAHACIRKHHPEMLALFDEKYGYKEDVAGIVFSTMDWAFKLGYSNAKCARIAVKALTKKGLIGKTCTYEAFSMWLDLRGLHHYVDKYFPVEGIPADFKE